MRDALPVETKVAATLYYLADESRYQTLWQLKYLIQSMFIHMYNMIYSIICSILKDYLPSRKLML